MCSFLVLRTRLLQEQHCQVHVGAEVDVHRHFESVDVHFVYTSSEADGVVVDEHVHRTVFLDYLLPGFLGLLRVC